MPQEGDRADVVTRPIDIVQPRIHALTLHVLGGTTVQLEQRHSEGGSGVVYRAEDLETGRALAVKILRIDRPEHYASLVREIRVLQQVESPWVVGYTSAGSLPDGRPWLAMEFLDGASLADRARPRLPSSLRLVQWLRQACRGLAAIHDAGWVHRDVKPSNIVCIEEGGVERIKIIDLGAAERIGSTPTALRGTPDYMAPEQAENKPADPRSDVYALGCTAFKLLTNRPLVAPRSTLDKINAHIDGVEVCWSERDRVPCVLRRLVERCLSRGPEARPPNMHVLERELADIELELERECVSRECVSRECDLPAVAIPQPSDTTAEVEPPIADLNDVPQARHRARRFSSYLHPVHR